MRRALGFVLLVLMVLQEGCGDGGASSSAASPAPVKPASYRVRASQRAIPFANGFSASSYSLAEHKIDTFRDHIYKKPSATETSKDFCEALLFGWRRDGVSQSLDQVLETSVGYVEGTGIVKVVQRAAGLYLETYYFSPMTGGADRSLVALVHARNEGPLARDCSLFALMDLHLGGDADALAEWAFHDPQAPYGPVLMEGKTGTGNRVIYKPIGLPPTHSSYGTAGASNPFLRVAQGQHLLDPQATLNADDVTLGLEWQIAQGGEFPQGGEQWAGLFVAFTGSGDEASLKKAAADFVSGKSPEELLAREKAFWDAYHAVEAPPAALTPQELALYRQSTAVIKMAQCREPGAPEGQILASLPEGQWNICWPRDACYAISALSRAGHLDEAKRGLEFFLRGTAGGYQAEVGRPYRISVCRYYGNGVEESDDNGNGPNIELDGFGLFLSAAGDYVERSNDQAFVAAHYARIRDEVADVLLACIGSNGLVKADSSIWERHLRAAQGTPDGKKQFAYTQITAASGLASAAAIAVRASDSPKASQWTAAAASLRAAIERELSLVDGALASSVEERALGAAFSADASVVEAVNMGLIPGTSPKAAATLTYLDRELKAFPLRSPGYLRNDDARAYGPQNWYDRQEWVFCDLRISSALVRMGRGAEARALLDWIGAQSAANLYLVAELYDEISGDYQGAVPMVGFGAGAYILAIYDLYLGGPT